MLYLTGWTAFFFVIVLWLDSRCDEPMLCVLNFERGWMGIEARREKGKQMCGYCV
jgi:hypothetical protein